MKVIIAGTRHEIDEEEFGIVMKERPFRITEIVSGGAVGVDRLGKSWAYRRRIVVTEFLANWARFGKIAGRFRNREMAEYADALIAFPCKHSRGTRDMISQAREIGLKVYVHEVKCFKEVP